MVMVKTLTQVVGTKGARGATSSHPRSVESEALGLDLSRSPRSVRPCGPTFSWEDRFVMCKTAHHPQQMTSSMRVVISVRAGGQVGEQASWQWGQAVGCLGREILLMIQG
jgi:hypothetical protein